MSKRYDFGSSRFDEDREDTGDRDFDLVNGKPVYFTVYHRDRYGR